jgi:tetratricopeptide (TPR) repeat protein
LQQHPRVFIGLGYCHRILKKYDKAVEAFNEALKLVKKSSVIVLVKEQRGLANFYGKKFAEAL